MQNRPEKSPPRATVELKDLHFFRGFGAPSLARIERFAYARAFEIHQIVYFPGDPCDYVYWVRSGRVRLMRIGADNREFTHRHIIAGEMFGEESLANTARRDMYAEALDPSVLYLLRTADFRRLVREESELSVRVAEHLCQRAVAAEGALAELIFKPVRTRIAGGILRLYEREKSHDGKTLRVTHQEIANLVGATRETTTAMLHTLRDEGVISLANRRVTVQNAAALERLARQE